MNRFLRILSRWTRLPEAVRCFWSAKTPWLWIGAYVVGRPLHYPCYIHLRSGASIQLYDHSELTTIWKNFFSNEYDVPREARTIVDAGANIGAFSLYLATRNPEPTIVAVEPFPETFARLGQTILLNGIETRVRAIQAAIASQDGFVPFDSRTESRSYCRRVVAPNTESIPTVEVPSLTISSILDQAGWNEVDYVKMDIEGGEYDALQNATPGCLSRIRALGLEYHDVSRTPLLWKKLEESGLTCVRHRPAGWSGLAEFRRT